MVVELFLFIAFVFVYVLTMLTVPAHIVRRIWFSAFVAAFAVAAVAVLAVSRDGQTVLMRESEFNWYFVLSVFGVMSVLSGGINLWIYRREIFALYRSKDPASAEKDS
jgi:hypothetical protein